MFQPGKSLPYDTQDQISCFTTLMTSFQCLTQINEPSKNSTNHPGTVRDCTHLYLWFYYAQATLFISSQANLTTIVFISDITRQPWVEISNMVKTRRVTKQAQRKQNWIGLAYWHLYPSAYVCVYAEARGVWGHAPARNLFEFDTVRWLFWGPKHHY